MFHNKIVVKVIWPIISVVLLASIFIPICSANHHINYLLLWIGIGVPFGIRKMFCVIIPHGYDIGGTVGIFALNIMLGGLIGGFIVCYRLLYAAFYVVLAIFNQLIIFFRWMRIRKLHMGTIG